MTKIVYGNSPAYSARRLLVGERADGDVDVPVIDGGPTPDHNTDPYFDNVVLLLGYESGSALDESAMKPKGDAGGDVSTNAWDGQYAGFPSGPLGVPNFNGGSPDENDDFNLSYTQMSEFTIEAWIYLPVTPTDVQVICGKSFFSIAWVFVTNASEMRFAYQVLESGFGGRGAFTNIVTSGANLQGNKWYYVAIDKDEAKNFRMYVGDPSVSPNAMCLAKYTPNDATIDNFWLESLSVGNIGLFGTNLWTGQIDELRITKGAARYRTDISFPMPTARWPRPVRPTPHTEVENEI